MIGAFVGGQLIYWMRNETFLAVVVPLIVFILFAKKQRFIASQYNLSNFNPEYFRKFTLLSSCLIGFWVGVYFMIMFTYEWELLRRKMGINRIYGELMNCTRDLKDCLNR